MDCQLLQTALQLVSRQFNVVSSAVSREQLFQCFSRGNLDVALISADLEGSTSAGLDVLPELHASYPQVPIVMLLSTGQKETIVRAFRGGAKGVFCRTAGKLDMLGKCIRSVHEGQIWATSEQLHYVLSNLVISPIRARSVTGKNLLTQREIEVAALVAEGLPNREVAQRLGISEHTVSNYLFRMYNKLGISSRVELVLYVTNQRVRQHIAS
jgi:two-component system nitrate/nitrite response regulator NarL